GDGQQAGAGRCGGGAVRVGLVTLLAQRGEGSPFFLAALVQRLLDRGLVVKHGPRWELGEPIEILQAATPDGIRALIEPRLDRLPPDVLRVLEAASVAGPGVAAPPPAAPAPPRSGPPDVARVEQGCDALGRPAGI